MLVTTRLSLVMTRCTVAVSLVAGALPVGAATLTVGAASSGCNHTNIQAEVNAAQNNPGADTVRI